MAATDGNHESVKTFRLVQVEGALEAIRHYVLRRMEDLHSEMARRFEDRRGAVEEIFSKIEAVDPKAGKVLTLAQFEEYVRLQRQLVDTRREISVSKEIQEAFASMLTDSRKFFAPPSRIYRFASRQPLTKTQRSHPEDIESRQLYPCTRMESCLEAARQYILGRMDREINRGKRTVELLIPEILADAELFSMDIHQFENYITGHRRLISETKRVQAAIERARADFETMLQDSREMVISRGKYHKFVTEPLKDEQLLTKREQECPRMYLFVSYIFVVLTFIASVFVC